MVLFDEDPVALIAETTNQFHIAPDRESLTRISDSLATLSTARQQRIDAQHSGLKALARRLHTLQSQLGFEEERHDAGKHASTILQMDTEKFQVAKAAQDAEVEGERLSAELAGLKAKLDVLEREGVEGGRRAGADAEDEVILKLQFYRSLGIDVVPDAQSGAFSRAVIRNPAKGDVNVINVDGNLSRSFYANMVWDNL
ncbi:Hypothetical protein R9X50_00058900 [Acrodontium crateriforme]|uniref:Kinetochore protein Spc24 n=1 Tax=Acrodontium crateriforme TaxID=150365 RepID=A0AAQ3R517_9PEZI|nr:Hypothetical protein R9X50_00058900 [Acrodontium crateriforme]